MGTTSKVWTPQEIITVRKIARRGGTIEEAKEAIQDPIGIKSFREKAKTYNVTFPNMRTKVHNGVDVKIDTDYQQERAKKKAQSKEKRT